MNVMNATAVSGRSTFNVGSTGGAAKKDASSVEGEFLKYAKMSPLERMRASILKGMKMTEEQLAALPQSERTKIEDQIKEQIKKMKAGNDKKGQLIDMSA